MAGPMGVDAFIDLSSQLGCEFPVRCEESGCLEVEERAIELAGEVELGLSDVEEATRRARQFAAAICEACKLGFQNGHCGLDLEKYDEAINRQLITATEE